MPRTEPGDRIYAIGDIHGCYDLMRQLLDRIGEHHDALPEPGALHIVFLGDLIDRGPDSAAVLNFVYDLQHKNDKVITLMGNHEQAMLNVLDGEPNVLRSWLGFGGLQTLKAFGVAPPDPDEPSREFLRRLQGVIPRPWLRWLRNLPLFAQSGDYFFCHAGIRPGVPLRKQSREDLLWIREDFLDDLRSHEAVIVHGHSIEPITEIRSNRIGVDSGAYRTGRLTAIYLEGDRQEFIAVESPGAASL
ncbi:MAG: serine/threonine protein phosphatase [Pseudomonadota bacterium]|nr:serine/threonine protein phosphatase [Pseudomonadota bacterium]